MPSTNSVELLPFTPPPYYVPKKDLPRSRGRSEASGGADGSRSGFSVLRRLSTRGSSNQSQDRVGKLTMKRQKPGLFINTNVMSNGRSPREITVRQALASEGAATSSFEGPPNATQAFPPQYSQQVQSHFSAATNSPSRFPSTYLRGSQAATQPKPPQSQDLFFAAPPRPASSLYSRSARNSFMNRDSLRKFASKNAQVRESNMTTFEEDFDVPKRQRAQSTDTIFEEDAQKTQGTTGTLNTTTPHRSKGWWNVVTTPFAKTPTEGQQGVTLHNAQHQYGEQQYPPVPVPPVPGLYQNHSHSVSATFTPSDQDIPIALSGDLMIALTNHDDKDDKDNSSNASAESLVDDVSTTSQMPFADVVKSPASRNDDMSPAGLVGREGVVPCSRATVQSAAVDNRHHIRDSIRPEHGLTHDASRASLQAVVNRTVRFITPRSSIYPPPPGQYTASREPFNPPPTPYYRRDSFNSCQDCDSDDMDRKQPQKRGKSKKGACCLPFGKSSKNKKKQDEKKMTRRRKCCFCCLCLVIIFLVLLALIILLAVMLGRKKTAKSSGQPTWVNTTKFPPMITGSLTVARPNLVSSQSSCVNPLTAWSCAVPKEQQNGILPNDPTQPDFLITVRFDNSSDLAKRSPRSSTVHAMHLLHARAFTPSPAVPALDEQSFLGNTTDKNVAPFEGEGTPFYISFNDPGSAISNNPSKVKRQSQPSSSVNTVPDLATNIPLPSLNPDNTPGPANLLALPQEQPLRLYNRGRDDEHYGFYTYYDKSIFLRSTTRRNSTSTSDVVSSDVNGGSTQAGANFRCTWTNTRFRVQIWTKRNRTQLLSKATSGSKLQGVDFTRPGTFPYPITITLDRHGGGLSTKILYCFAMDVNGKIVKDQRSFLGEDRAFNGTIVNPSPGPFASAAPKITTAEGGPGGIDGGTGGCGCSWQNWS